MTTISSVVSLSTQMKVLAGAVKPGPGAQFASGKASSSYQLSLSARALQGGSAWGSGGNAWWQGPNGSAGNSSIGSRQAHTYSLVADAGGWSSGRSSPFPTYGSSWQRWS